MLARKAFSLVFVIALIFSAYAKASPAVAQTLAAWDGPNVIWNDGNYPANLSMSNDGSVVVALLPNSGTDQYTRSIAIAHRVGDAWGAPQVIATNGRHSDDPFQALPSDTHPVISGDGQTIAYLGFASNLSTNSAYIIRRQSDNTWSSPQNVTPTLPNVHNLMSLNFDGTVLAVSDFPFYGTQQLYVLTRSGETWSEPVQVTPTSPDPLTGGGNPSLSASGNDLVYIHNARLTYLARSGSTWGYPQELTDNTWDQYQVEFPQITADGSTIYYWLNHLELQGSAYVLVDRDLYLKRKVNTTWSAPIKITEVPVRVLSFYDSPATANLTATRFIYPRPIVTGDTISAADLEMVEFDQGVWKTSLLLKSSNAYDILSNPVLTPDSSRLVFRSGQRQAGSEFVYGGLWEMTKEPDPVITYPPTFISTAIITTIEGKLYTYEVKTTDQNIGDKLIITAPVKPAWLTLVDHGNGTATLSGTPSKSNLGLHLVVLTVTDSTTLSATQSFEIKVTVDPTTVFPIPLIGGLFSSAFDQTLFTFLGGTFNEPVNVTYTSWRDRGGPPPMMPPPPPGLFGIGHFFELTAKTESTQEEVQPNKPVTVEIDFGSFPPLPTILGTLKLFRVDGSSFIPLPGVDDPANKKLTAEIDHFSFFSVMGETNQVYLPLIRK